MTPPSTTSTSTPQHGTRPGARPILPRKRIGGLRSSVGVENVAVSHRGLVVGGSGARVGWARTLSGCVAVDLGQSLVLVSLRGSMVVEGTFVIRGIRGVFAV